MPWSAWDVKVRASAKKYSRTVGIGANARRERRRSRSVDAVPANSPASCAVVLALRGGLRVPSFDGRWPDDCSRRPLLTPPPAIATPRSRRSVALDEWFATRSRQRPRGRALGMESGSVTSSGSGRTFATTVQSFRQSKACFQLLAVPTAGVISRGSGGHPTPSEPALEQRIRTTPKPGKRSRSCHQPRRPRSGSCPARAARSTSLLDRASQSAARHCPLFRMMRDAACTPSRSACLGLGPCGLAAVSS